MLSKLWIFWWMSITFRSNLMQVKSKSQSLFTLASLRGHHSFLLYIQYTFFPILRKSVVVFVSVALQYNPSKKFFFTDPWCFYGDLAVNCRVKARWRNSLQKMAWTWRAAKEDVEAAFRFDWQGSQSSWMRDTKLKGTCVTVTVDKLKYTFQV